MSTSRVTDLTLVTNQLIDTINCWSKPRSTIRPRITGRSILPNLSTVTTCTGRRIYPIGTRLNHTEMTITRTWVDTCMDRKIFPTISPGTICSKLSMRKRPRDRNWTLRLSAKPMRVKRLPRRSGPTTGKKRELQRENWSDPMTTATSIAKSSWRINCRDTMTAAMTQANLSWRENTVITLVLAMGWSLSATMVLLASSTEGFRFDF